MNLSALTGGGMKAVQRGTLAHTGGGSEETVTVTSVNVSKSSLSVIGEVNAATWRARLVNATTIGVTSNVAASFSWELIERY